MSQRRWGLSRPAVNTDGLSGQQRSEHRLTEHGFGDSVQDLSWSWCPLKGEQGQRKEANIPKE